MKKYFCIFLIFLFSCVFVVEEDLDDYFGYPVPNDSVDTPILDLNIRNNCHGFEDIWNTVKEYTNLNIKYVEDGPYDDWQPPKKTHKIKKGDCEDKSIYFACLVKKYTNKSCTLISIYNFVSHQWHVIAEYDGFYFGLTNEYINSDGKMRIRAKYTYKEALVLAEYIK